MARKQKKISDMIKQLERIKKKYGDLKLVYAIDDEGNDFKPIYFDASTGIFKDTGHGDRYFESIKLSGNAVDSRVNAVCIN